MNKSEIKFIIKRSNKCIYKSSLCQLLSLCFIFMLAIIFILNFSFSYKFFVSKFLSFFKSQVLLHVLQIAKCNTLIRTLFGYLNIPWKQKEWKILYFHIFFVSFLNFGWETLENHKFWTILTNSIWNGKLYLSSL